MKVYNGGSFTDILIVTILAEVLQEVRDDMEWKEEVERERKREWMWGEGFWKHFLKQGFTTNTICKWTENNGVTSVPLANCINKNFLLKN